MYSKFKDTPVWANLFKSWSFEPVDLVLNNSFLDLNVEGPLTNSFIFKFEFGPFNCIILSIPEPPIPTPPP